METMTLSVEESAELLGIGRGTAYRAVARGEIPALRLGRRLRIPKPALLRLLERPHDFARAHEGEEGARK